MNEQPDDAQYKWRGCFYKEGIHGVVFIWLDTCWVRSTKNINDLKDGLGVTTFRSNIDVRN